MKSGCLCATLLGFLGACSAHAAPAQWISRGAGAGGGMYSPAISPFDGSEFYLACDMSELLHTTNAGAAWNTIDFNQIESFHGTEVQFTSDPLVLYAVDYHQSGGTGPYSQAPTKSLDGGAHWSRLPNASWPYGQAYRVIADPQSTSRLVASTQGNVYCSTNGGGSFSLVSSLPTNRVAGAFFDGTNIFIACNAGLLVSTDGGASFTNAGFSGIDSNTSFYSFAGASQNGTTRFYCVTTLAQFAQPDNDPVPSSTNRIYTLDWGQPAWTMLTNNLTTNDRPVLVAMARSDISVAYVAAVKRNGIYPDNNSVFKTVNQGTNWVSVFTISNNLNIATGWGGVPSVCPVDFANPLGLAVDPNNANRAMKCDSGLIYMTTNGGAAWFQIYLNAADQNPTNTLIASSKYYHGVGLEVTAAWWINWYDRTNLLAGFSDIRMLRSKDGGASWGFDYSNMNIGDEVYQVLKHPSLNLLYAINSTMITPYQLLGADDHTIDSAVGAVYVSADAGKTWSIVNNFGMAPMWMAIDSSNANGMFVSTANSTNGGIYWTTNLLAGAGAAWQKLSKPARANGHPYNISVLNDGTLLCTFGSRYTNAFTASSGVFLCTNPVAAAAGDASAWLDRSATGMVYWTHDVVVDPNDPGQNTWYAGVWNAFGIGAPGYPNPSGLGGLYKTTNRGVNWTNLFTNDAVTSCTISPVNSNEMYLCTHYIGLWRSTNINAAAPVFAPLANYPFRQPTRVFFNPYNSNEIWIVSHGNGIALGVVSNWTIAVATATNGAINPSGSIQVYDGQSASFQILPDPYYHVADLITNGAGAGIGTNNFTWDHVTNNGSFAASFAANLATNGTPHWWLAAFGLATNDAEALADQDGDGEASWEEYISDTVPTSSASVFSVVTQVTGAEATFFQVDQTSTGRLYDVYGNTNLVDGSAWSPLGYSLPGTGSNLTIVVTNDSLPRFYRTGVRAP